MKYGINNVALVAYGLAFCMPISCALLRGRPMALYEIFTCILHVNAHRFQQTPQLLESWKYSGNACPSIGSTPCGNHHRVIAQLLFVVSGYPEKSPVHTACGHWWMFFSPLNPLVEMVGSPRPCLDSPNSDGDSFFQTGWSAPGAGLRNRLDPSGMLRKYAIFSDCSICNVL